MPTRQEKQWQHYENNKAMRKVRKEIKRNRKPGRVRRRDWTRVDPDAFDEEDFEDEERVMPRGEQERRQADIAAALAPPRGGRDRRRGSNPREGARPAWDRDRGQ